MVDDATGCGVVDSGEAFQIVGRGAIDVDGALLFEPLNYTLRGGFGIASGTGGGAGGLFANFVGAAVVGCAGGESDKGQGQKRYESHGGLDADDPGAGLFEIGATRTA